MPAMGVYDQIKSAFQDIIAPELHAFRGDIQRLDQKIDYGLANLDQKITSLDQKVDQKIASLEERIDHRFTSLDQKIENLDTRLTVKVDSLRTEMVSMKGELLAEIRRVDARIDGVDRELRTAIDIRERLAALEARRAP